MSASKKYHTRGGPCVRDPVKSPHLAAPKDGDDRVYTREESEYLSACERYRAARGLRYMTALGYREVLLSLGYRRG